MGVPIYTCPKDVHSWKVAWLAGFTHVLLFGASAASLVSIMSLMEVGFLKTTFYNSLEWA